MGGQQPRPVLSNLFDPVGHITIDFEAAGWAATKIYWTF